MPDVSLPRASEVVLDGNGLLRRPWAIFLSAVVQAVRDAVIGASGLSRLGAMTKVIGKGKIGDARPSDFDLVVLRQSTQANLAALAGTLAALDAGLLVEVTDYAHILRWTGSAWEWGPGEGGGGYVRPFAVDPTGAGWQLCDGSTVAYLKSDGTTANYTTPDLVSTAADAAYLKFGEPVSGPNAAVAPTLSGAIDAASTGITASTSGPIGGATNVTAGGVPVASSLHTHSVSITDPQHTHTLSGGAVSDDGEPRNMVLRPFFRR